MLITPPARLESLAEAPEDGGEQDAIQDLSIQEGIYKSPSTVKKRKKRTSVLLKSRRKSRPSLESTASEVIEKPIPSESQGLVVGHQTAEDEAERERNVRSNPEEEGVAVTRQPTPPTTTEPIKATPPTTGRTSIVPNSGRKLGHALTSRTPKADLALDRSSIESHAPNNAEEEQQGIPENAEDIREAEEVHEGDNVKPAEASAAVPTKAVTPQAKRRKKRKSIVMGRKKRRSSGATGVTPRRTADGIVAGEEVVVRKRANIETSPSAVNVGQTQKKRGVPKLPSLLKSKRPLAVSKGNATIQRQKSALARKKDTTMQDTAQGANGRRRALPWEPEDENEEDESEEAESEQDEEEEEEEEEEKESRTRKAKKGRGPRAGESGANDLENGEQVPQKRQKRQKANPSSSKPKPRSTSSQTRPEAQRDSGDKIHVTVQRISHVHRLNFNPDSDDDLAGPGAFPKKKSPNAIDVLAQICREIIGKSIATVKEGIGAEASTARKSELRRKKEAFERYGDELDGRLFQMTTALDHNHALAVKLKHANKGQVALREELLGLRRQRQEIELQMDEVRRRNEEEAREAAEEQRLREMLQDIQVAVQRGRAAEEQEGSQGEDGEDESRNGKGGDADGGPTLAMRLRRLGETVSSADGRVGMLEKVRGFNRLLEEAIAKL